MRKFNVLMSGVALSTLLGIGAACTSDRRSFQQTPTTVTTPITVPENKVLSVEYKPDGSFEATVTTNNAGSILVGFTCQLDGSIQEKILPNGPTSDGGQAGACNKGAIVESDQLLVAGQKVTVNYPPKGNAAFVVPVGS